MIAYMLAELAEWRERRMTRTLCGAILLLACAGFVGPLHPLVVAMASTLVFAASAWTAFRNPPNAPRRRVDPLTFPSSPADIAAGRGLAALAIGLGLLFAVSPVLVAAGAAWGISGRIALQCLLVWLSAYITAASVGFLSAVVFDRAEGLPGFAIYVLWLFAPFFSEAFRPSNPFVQTWMILRMEGGGVACGWAAGEIAVSAAVFGLSVLALRSKRRYRDA